MRVFSGIRPSGEIHLGNYLGAIKQWIKLQQEHDCLFCIVDWHAITTPYNSEQLQKNIYEMALAFLASGVDPEKNILFAQSSVKEHTELAWLLSSITPVGRLFRMTQYKEKSAKLDKEKINAGLLNYPVLMAADILLYQTEIVPVGEDQVQHVELARSIARRFNQRWGKTFRIPKAVVAKKTARIKCLQEPKKKMSKTGNPRGAIGIFDSPEEINKKVMAAITDSQKSIKYDPIKKPGISNLLAIHSSFSKKTISQLEKEFKDKGYGDLKESLAQTLISSLAPFREAKKKYKEKKVEKILCQGAEKARETAETTMKKARQRMGL